MKKFEKIYLTRRFRWGGIVFIVSLIALIGIYMTKAETVEKLERLKKENPVIKLLSKEHYSLEDSERKQLEEKWKSLSPEKRDSITAKYMSANNKVAQVTYGPYIFWLTLITGFLSIMLSFVKIKSASDKVLEEMENNNENNNKEG